MALRTEDLFPGIEYVAVGDSVTANSVAIPISALPGITAALASGVNSDGRALAFAFAEQVTNRTAAVIAAQGAAAVVGFTATQPASTLVPGQPNQLVRNYTMAVTTDNPDMVGGAIALLPQG